MAFKFEIRDTHFLVITDTTIVDPVETILVDMPKADAYFDHRLLKVRQDLQKSEHVYIYDKNCNSTEGSKMFKHLLSECLDNNDVPFTKASFITWMRTNTGFKTASGGSGALPWLYSAINYTDLTTVIAPTANEGELAVVYGSQGVWPINRRLKGVYMYQSGVWEYANQELQDRLSAKIDSTTGEFVDNTDPLNPIVIEPAYSSLKSLDNIVRLNQTTESLMNMQVNQYEQYLEIDFSPTTTGKYTIDTSFTYSHNVTNDNFIAELSVAGTGPNPLNSNYVFLSIESKDSAGGPGILSNIVQNNIIIGNAVTGTDQRVATSHKDEFLFIVGNTYKVTLLFGSETENDRATIYKGILAIKQQTII